MQLLHPSRLFQTSLLVTALVLALPAIAQPDDAEAKGQHLLAQTLDAHGGLEHFQHFGSLRYHTDGLPYSAAAPLDFDHTADLVARYHRMEGSSAKGSFVAGANQTQGWSTDLDALGIPPRWVNHGNSYFAMMPFVFADPAAQVRALGSRQWDDRTYDAIAVSYRHGAGDTFEDDYVLYLDPTTHRLALIDFSVTYGPMRGDTAIADLPRRSLEFVAWQEVQGLWVPQTLHYAPWQRTAEGGQRAEDGVQYTLSNVRFDAERPDAALFIAPEGAGVEH